MDESACQAWWPLHVRVAKGETLNVDELAAYEAGLPQLGAEEAATVPLDGQVNPLRDLRERILAADIEHQRRSKQYETMCAEMARLEAMLDDRTPAGTVERRKLKKESPADASKRPPISTPES